MKISVTIFLTDLLPEKRRLFHKIVKNKIFQQTSVEDGLAKLKVAGVDGIELFLPSFMKITDEDIVLAKQTVNKSDLPIMSVHQVLRFFTKTKMKEIIRLFEIAKLLEVKVIVLHLSSAGKQIFNVDYVNQLIALQKKYGITIGFENREKFIGSYFQTHTWHETKFAELLKERGLFITLDTTHLAHSGGDIVAFADKHSNQIVNIHLSDYKPDILNASLRPLRFKHLPLGKGELRIEAFLQTLQKQQYKGLLTMEIHGDLEGLCKSAEMIKHIVSTSS